MGLCELAQHSHPQIVCLKKILSCRHFIGFQFVCFFFRDLITTYVCDSIYDVVSSL